MFQIGDLITIAPVANSNYNIPKGAVGTVLGLFADEHGDGLYVDFDLRRFGLTLRQVLPPCDTAQETRLSVSLDEPIKGRRMSVALADAMHFEMYTDKPRLFFSRPVLSRAYCGSTRLRMTDVTGSSETLEAVLICALRFPLYGAVVGRFVYGENECEVLRLYIEKTYDLQPLMAHLETELGVQCLMGANDAN